MAFFMSQKKQTRSIYKMDNLHHDIKMKKDKRVDDLELKPFEEIYTKRMKQLAEQQ